MSKRYYDDLSDSESSCDEDEDDDHAVYPTPYDKKYAIDLHNTFESRGRKRPLHQTAYDYYDNNDISSMSIESRIILHLDVDCFYCQCEHLDRKIDRDRPLAIGQKHIIVTCNYAARNQLGLQKLMSRREAQERYPNLLTVDGSDLEQYRKHGRAIYDCFRRTLLSYNAKCAVSKGCMDEMIADITILKYNDSIDSDNTTNNDDVYIYGQQKETTVLREDQSGATSEIVLDRRGIHQRMTTNESQRLQELFIVSKFALRLRQCILDETGFTTTIGLSTNPLLSKIASGLKKPGKVNILLPDDGRILIQSMPLRKIPGIGSRTMKILQPCLQEWYNNNSTNTTYESVPVVDKSKVWTCGHLLKIPPCSIVEALKKLSSVRDGSAEEQCKILLQKCRGIDQSMVHDDSGALSKTLSVENSFRRGTMTTKPMILHSMESLYARLVRLLHHRYTDDTKMTQSADVSISSAEYPTTIKLTVRFAPIPAEKVVRRFGVTVSRQTQFDGQKLRQETIQNKQEAIIKQAINPLLKELIFDGCNATSIDVTRINVALTNFTGSVPLDKKYNNKPFQRGQSSIVEYSQPIHHNSISQSNIEPSQMETSPSSVLVDSFSSKRMNSNYRPGVQANSTENPAPSCISPTVTYTTDDIDMQVLSELPHHIAKEILKSIEVQQTSKKYRFKPSNGSKTLKDYFSVSDSSKRPSKR